MNQIENVLCNMNSFKAINDILNGVTLHDLQCIDVMKMLYHKRSIVIYPTGTGKTLLAAAVMECLWRENPSRKFIIFGLKDQLIQTPKKLEHYLGRSVITTDATADSLSRLVKNNFTMYPILLATHECLCNENFLYLLNKVKDNYCGIFIDEAHKLNHIGYADKASVLKDLAKKFEYCFALTATPITTNVKQLARLASIVHLTRYQNYNICASRLRAGSKYLDEDPMFFILRTAEELRGHCDYRTKLLYVEPQAEQIHSVDTRNKAALFKGHGSVHQAQALLWLLRKDYKGKRVLVYVRQHAIREWLLTFFKDTEFRYECINGNTSKDERSRIMCEFNEIKSLDIIFTSITTAIDLDCDCVVFYEFTIELYQMIGRAHRGLVNKSLDIIFEVTADSYEIDYLEDKLIKRLFVIRDILHNRCDEVEELQQLLDQENCCLDSIGENYKLYSFGGVSYD